jgi:hypothetical protein
MQPRTYRSRLALIDAVEVIVQQFGCTMKFTIVDGLMRNDYGQIHGIFPRGLGGYEWTTIL